MANRSLGTLTLDLVAKTAGLETGLDRAARVSDQKTREIERHSKDRVASIEKSWGGVGSFIGGAFAALSAGAVFGSFIQNTINAQNEQAQLQAVLKSTGESAGFTAEKLNDMSQSLANNSNFTAGEITNAQTRLLAYTGIVGEQVPRAMQAVVDMSARLGMSLDQSAETIGKALDVPSEGMTALTRQGFRFNEEQQKVIKNLEATGRVAEAQGIILDTLAGSYGGAAAAARDSLGGALKALSKEVENLMTGDANGGIKGLQITIEGLVGVLRSETFGKGFELFVDSVKILGPAAATFVAVNLAGSLLETAKAAVTARVNNYANLVSVKASTAASLDYARAKVAEAAATVAAASGMQRLTLVQTQLIPAQRALTAATEAYATAAKAASVLSFVGGPLGAINLALTAGVLAWGAFGGSSLTAAEETARSVATMKGSIDEVIKKYGELNKLQRQQAINIKTDEIDAAVKEARDAVNDLIRGFEPSLAEGTRAAARFRADFTNEIKGIATDTSLSSSQQASALAEVINRYADAAGSSTAYRSRMTDLAQAVVLASGNVREYGAALLAMTNFQDAATVSIDNTNAVLERQKTNLAKFMETYATNAEKARTEIAKQKELLGSLYTPELEKRILARFKDPKPTGTEAASVRLIKQLKEQSALIGEVTEQEKLAAKIREGTVTFRNKSEQELAMSYAKRIDLAKQEQEDLEQRGQDLENLFGELKKRPEDFQGLYKNLFPERAQVDEFIGSIALLTEALDEGQISADDFDLAVKRLTSQGTDAFTQFATQAASNIQDQLGTTLYNALSGNFDDIAGGFAQMLAKMATELAASQVLKFLVGDFGQSGKSNFGGVLGGLAGSIGNWWSGNTGIAGNSTDSIWKALAGAGGKFADGGYTGDGSRMQEAGTVHKGEYVFKASRVKQLGLNYLEGLHRSSGRGYDNGGAVGISPSVGPSSGIGKLEINNNFSSDGTAQTQSNGPRDEFFSRLNEQIVSLIRRELQLANMQGGANWNQRNGMG